MSVEAIRYWLPQVHGWLALKRAKHAGLDTPKARCIESDCNASRLRAHASYNLSARKQRSRRRTKKRNRRKRQNEKNNKRLGAEE